MEAGRWLQSRCEEELLARISTRDSDAFTAFYDSTAAILLHVANSILRDPAAAEDVLQDVYLRIWNKAEEYDPALGKPISWAMALTRNRALDFLRSRSRRAAALEKAASENEEQFVASNSSADDVMLLESAALVRQALATLPALQQRALELSLLKGLPHAEIADLMQQPLGTVKAWIRRGIIEIRQQMKNDR
jgi:RNA polymerase sigma-70 factor (ECF subfamily)